MKYLIDKQAALDALKNSRFPGAPYVDAGISIAIGVICDLPPAQPECQWIPCSERLPEHGGWYITTRRIKKDNDKCVGLLWYSTAHGWEWDNAIAWMPLPEPYREVDG